MKATCSYDVLKLLHSPGAYVLAVNVNNKIEKKKFSRGEREGGTSGSGRVH